MTDDPSRWPRVKEIFYSALMRAPDARMEFVREACDEDAALRSDVESLLAAHADAGDFAERPAIEALPHAGSPGAHAGVPALTSGFELGPYRIVEPLDSGAMGEVYRARDTRLGREVAVKVLPTMLSGDPRRVARLKREARVLAALNHPHIATIHGLEIAEGVHALVMELIEGPTLADRLASGPLDRDEALKIACEIAEALEAAHEKGIIHCDLKPANIKLTATSTVKVLDFGLAKAMASNSGDVSWAVASGAGTREGMIAGTPAYMSPEQARGEWVDARSDVWAFGCVVYEMLTARPAFGRKTLADTLAALLEREPEWERLPPNVPASMRRMLRRCLERDPRRRLHHIADARIEIEDATNAPEASDSLIASSSRRRERMLGISTAVLALALAAVLGAWVLRSPANVPELRVAEITTPRTSDPFSFAVSPDGRRIAFVADHEGQPTLWVRALDVAGSEALPGTQGARRPFWSSDSRSIGFFAGSELKRIEARGGPAHTIANVVAGMAAAWAPDGTILLSSTTSLSLLRVNATGGTVQAATAPPAESTGHGHPQFLPGGRQFLFFVGGADAVRGVYVGSLDSSEVTRLLASDTQGAYVSPGWLLFIRQGTLLAQRFDVARRTLSGEPMTVADTVTFDAITGVGAFSVSGAGVMAYRAGGPSVTRFSWFDRSGNALGTLGSEQAGLSNPKLSPDGRRVAVERTLQNETDLWLFDSTHQTRFTRAASGSMTRLPVWSSDGGRIAFESVGPNSVKLSVKPSTGGGDEEMLVLSPEVKIPCDWSPDGRFLMYYVPDPKTGTDLWVVPLEGTRMPFAFLKTEANELWGQFSPDGRWLAYQSNETGRYEIYVRPFPGPGGQFPISTAGGVYPRWSRDGRELYYIAPDAKMMAAPIRATATMFEAGLPTTLFQTRKVGGGSNVIGRGHQYDVARDGRFLISVEAESSVPPITLLMNWKP
jgi:serine/threonine protein kinase/Tol biopolymer transport system component